MSQVVMSEPADRRQVRPTATEAAWDRLMTLQADLTMPLELEFYRTCAEWRRARSVLDMGTGNGHYIRRLAAQFPEKRYIGIDNCDAYVGIAESRQVVGAHGGDLPVEFRVTDVFDAVGPYDIVIARLLVQHLGINSDGPSRESQLSQFLDRIADVLRPGGALLVIESYDAERLFYPVIEPMDAFFATLRRHRLEHGCNRDAGSILTELALQRGFLLSKRAIHVIPSTLRNHRSLFLKTYLSVLEVVQQNFAIDVDYDEIRHALFDWYQVPWSYAQIGVSMSCYRLRGG